MYYPLFFYNYYTIQSVLTHADVFVFSSALEMRTTEPEIHINFLKAQDFYELLSGQRAVYPFSKSLHCSVYHIDL